LPCPPADLFSLFLLLYDLSDAAPTRTAEPPCTSFSGQSLTVFTLSSSYNLYPSWTHLRDTLPRYTVPMCLHENGKRGFILHVFSFLRLLAYDLILIGFRPPELPYVVICIRCIRLRANTAVQERPVTPRSAVDSDHNDPSYNRRG
jgi:hypothetical protein